MEKSRVARERTGIYCQPNGRCGWGHHPYTQITLQHYNIIIIRFRWALYHKRSLNLLKYNGISLRCLDDPREELVLDSVLSMTEKGITYAYVEQVVWVINK